MYNSWVIERKNSELFNSNNIISERVNVKNLKSILKSGYSDLNYLNDDSTKKNKIPLSMYLETLNEKRDGLCLETIGTLKNNYGRASIEAISLSKLKPKFRQALSSDMTEYSIQNSLPTLFSECCRLMKQKKSEYKISRQYAQNTIKFTEQLAIKLFGNNTTMSTNKIESGILDVCYKGHSLKKWCRENNVKFNKCTKLRIMQMEVMDILENYIKANNEEIFNEIHAQSDGENNAKYILLLKFLENIERICYETIICNLGVKYFIYNGDGIQLHTLSLLPSTINNMSDIVKKELGINIQILAGDHTQGEKLMHEVHSLLQQCIINMKSKIILIHRQIKKALSG